MKKAIFIISLIIIAFYIIIGLLAPFIATKYPYKIKVNDETYYPAWENFLSFYQLKKSNSLHNPEVLQAIDSSKSGGLVPFEPSYIDVNTTLARPPGSRAEDTQYIHILGTDNLGKDLLSNLIHGVFNSLTISFSSVTMAFLIALFLAVPCSYWGDRSIRFTRPKLLAFLLITWILFVMLFYVRPLVPFYELGILIRCVLFLTSTIFFGQLLRSTSPKKSTTEIYFPLDGIMMRILEFQRSIPKLLILLVVLATIPSVRPTTFCILISLLIWPYFYRYIRASIFEQKQSALHESLRNLGLSSGRILLIHFVPKALRTIMIPYVFSLVSVILFEATLSFLGIGLGSSYVSWGQILAEARDNMSAWWLAVFPGIAIFILVVALNRIGDYLLEHWT